MEMPMRYIVAAGKVVGPKPPLDCIHMAGSILEATDTHALIQIDLPEESPKEALFQPPANLLFLSLDGEEETDVFVSDLGDNVSVRRGRFESSFPVSFGDYPKTKNCFPEGSPKEKIRVNAKKLVALVTAMLEAEGSEGTHDHSLIIELRGETRVIALRMSQGGDDAIRGLLMPLRPREEG